MFYFILHYIGTQLYIYVCPTSIEVGNKLIIYLIYEFLILTSGYQYPYYPAIQLWKELPINKTPNKDPLKGDSTNETHTLLSTHGATTALFLRQIKSSKKEAAAAARIPKPPSTVLQTSQLTYHDISWDKVLFFWFVFWNRVYIHIYIYIQRQLWINSLWQRKVVSCCHAVSYMGFWGLKRTRLRCSFQVCLILFVFYTL